MIKATSTFNICETSTLEVSNHPIPFHSIFHPQNKVLHDYASSSKLPFQKEREAWLHKKKKKKKKNLAHTKYGMMKKRKKKIKYVAMLSQEKKYEKEISMDF